MTAKIRIKNESIHYIIGFFFSIDLFGKAGLADNIDNTLNVNCVLATYSHSNIMETMMSVFLTGGSWIEDVK